MSSEQWKFVDWFMFGLCVVATLYFILRVLLWGRW